MADTTVVVEGKIKFRDGKKWKSRWCVMKKPSPVADRLQVLLYKDVKEAMRDGGKPKSVFPLEGFYGIESFQLDKEANVMALVCQKQVTLLAYESRENMIQFEIKIRRSLGQEHQFPVRLAKVPHNSRLPLELIRLHIHGQKFCMTAYIPPKILQSWQICDLRRFGSVDGKFCFEGGSKCGRGMGIHVALSEQADEIASIVQQASQGKLPSCHSNINKRSSQIPGAFDSVGSSFGSGNHGLPPSMLGCCGDMRNQEDWGWQKRHSISVMDYRRMGALAEKSKLMSIENLERQRLLAVYDVPPKRIRKVEANVVSQAVGQKSERDSAKSCVSCSALLGRGSDTSRVCSHGASYSSLPYENSSQPYVTGLSTACSAKDLFKLQGRGDYHGYSRSLGSQGNYQLSVIEDEIRMANDRTKRKEALQKLQREESSLQREITLLDEILQVCKFDDETKTVDLKGTKAPTIILEKSSSLPQKTKKDLWVDTKKCNTEVAQLRTTRSEKQNMEANCLSPNLLSKLREIPSHSKLLAPLPYVNLSKYDEDDKSSHVCVPGSGDKLVVSSACSSSLSNVSVFNKENSPHTQAIKQKLGARSSSESRIALKSSQWEEEEERGPQWQREPIYANECIKKENTPPPELPPKGPALLRKNLSKTSTVVAAHPGGSLTPPALPSRDRSRSVGSQGKLHGYDNAPMIVFQTSKPSSTSSVGPQDSYLLMGGFQEEHKAPTEGHPFGVGIDSHRTSVTSRAQIIGAQGGRYTEHSSQYMEMGQFEPECPKLRISDSSSSESDLYGYSSSPRPSVELRITEPIDEAASYMRQPRQESNYMEMTGLQSNRNSQVLQNLQTLQTYVSSTPGGDSLNQNTNSEVTRPAMPFPNLLNFQKRQSDQKKTPSKSNISSNTSQAAENTPSQETPKEGGGFLARFMRRSSRDQKAASQSQENLTGARSRASYLERSQSDQGEQSKPELPETVPHIKVGRQRSSSFPNRLSYQEANTEIKMPPSPKDLPPPLPPERNRAREYRGSKSLSLDDKPGAPVEIISKSSNCQGLKRNITEPLLKVEETKPEMRVLTVLHVQQQLQLTNPYLQLTESSKTDDEKLIELLQNGGSSRLGMEEKGNYACLSELKSKMSLPLPVKKQLSASEKAAEIARHVTSLPPFIPPKTKPYPSTLSPVIESQLSPRGMDSDAIYVEMKELPSKRSSSTSDSFALNPAGQKDKARATLRICPPVEDENGKIWVPRSNLNSAETASGSSPHSAKCCDTQNLHYSALVVSVDDLNDKLDAISVSSHESSDNHSIRSEDTVRSSPASTILRPRSGRDYQFVERRHTASESCTSSPQTPYSPSSGTVFSFESTMSNSSHGEEYNAYMNVDMTTGAKDSVFSHKHVSDHEVSPERTFREKLISERDRRSSEREKVTGERNRLNSERDRLNSEKEHLHSPRNNLKGDKNQLSPERDKVGQAPDKHDTDMVLHCSDKNSESPEKETVNTEIDRLSTDRKANSDRDTSLVEGDMQDDLHSSSGHSPSCTRSASPPLSPRVPMSPMPPEQVNPQLNYAEIDLSTACAAASPTESKRKPKKTVPTTPIAYATIDMLATHAVKQAGIEHAQSREDSLRRSVSVCTRKNSTPLVKDRKFSMRERKMSTGSLGDT
ncbi:uncharacterized protein LOC124113708 [Haliotis rufescens]|uniref:uncharacterized protein LOC124113708 n=1 Tax=Haliotis rufescens TaxID=6454 RepID=UPI00201F3792|nr:uncharacterized protein LOC124113708 [Haliotis rufescens]